jgi:hypothetical protein
MKNSSGRVSALYQARGAWEEFGVANHAALE